MSINGLSNLLSQIKVGLKSCQVSVFVKNTRYNVELLIFLQRQGYIGGFYIGRCQTFVKVFLRYIGVKGILTLGNQISYKSRRFFLSAKQFRFFLKGHKSSYIYLISSSFGFLFGSEVLKYSIGGEILFYFS